MENLEDFKPVKLESDGTDRDVMIAAARAFDETRRKMNDLEDQLHKAVAGLESKNATIDELKILLEQERNNVASFRAERDEEKEQAARVRAGLANCQAILDQLELPPPQKKKSRNGPKPVVAEPVIAAVISELPNEVTGENSVA